MVRGICCFRVANCARYSKSKTILQEQTREVLVIGDSNCSSRDAHRTLHAICQSFWILPAAIDIPPDCWHNRSSLHRRGGTNQEGFLQDGEVLAANVLGGTQLGTPRNLSSARSEERRRGK